MRAGLMAYASLIYSMPMKAAACASLYWRDQRQSRLSSHLVISRMLSAGSGPARWPPADGQHDRPAIRAAASAAAAAALYLSATKCS